MDSERAGLSMPRVRRWCERRCEAPAFSAFLARHMHFGRAPGLTEIARHRHVAVAGLLGQCCTGYGQKLRSLCQFETGRRVILKIEWCGVDAHTVRVAAGALFVAECVPCAPGREFTATT